MKLAVIGAGSTYTPELVSGLMREQQRLDVQELILHDIDPQRLTELSFAQAAPSARTRRESTSPEETTA